jgi:ATP-dependent DNA helicase RecG
MKLTDALVTQFRLDERQKKALEKLGLTTVRDLLFYFPTRYSNISEIKLIRDAIAGESVTLYGKIGKLKTKKAFRTKMPMGEGELEDSSGKIKIIWFNQAYLAKMVHDGETVELTGRITEDKNGTLTLANPELKSKNSMPIDAHDSLFTGKAESHVYGFPVYPETRGITSKFIYHAVQKILKSGALTEIRDYIPEHILKKYSLPKLSSALVWMHGPENDNDATAARKRFAFEEVFLIQLARQQERAAIREQQSYQVIVDEGDVKQFVERFPFQATVAQHRVITQILEDLKKSHPMGRLLEGDVGSGKTAVAATISYAIIKNRPFDKNQNKLQSFGSLQVAYMAPTEILATQLFENFIQYFKHTGINIGLITGSGCRKFPSKVASSSLTGGWTNISRTQLEKWVVGGEIPILIGTHTLIQKSVKFKHLALVIIDEQHRFGTAQRAKLAKKESTGWMMPHLLSMTATPIPRTLALTIYGDLDLSLLDQMPTGRKQVETEIILPHDRMGVYEKIRSELAAGRQLYVICPRIHEPDPTKELALQAKSVTAEAKRLSDEVFPEYMIDILHSKMTKDQKESVMKEFAQGRTDILVATSVVEVGVNVPNATLIIIEGAERFGLAQLHQLRGRVIRSNHQAYCYLFAEAKSTKTMDRLKALKSAKNGFELAELDLGLRGSGELAGAKQWGISDLGMEAIKNIKMVEAARAEAIALIENDSALTSFPTLVSELHVRSLHELHFE